MANNYDTPGVYVEEVSTGAKPIESVSTRVLAVIGVAPKNDAYVNQPRECNNWSEFVRDFCTDDSKGTNLAYAVYGYFMNGGGRCYVLNIGAAGTVSGDARKGTGINAFEAYDEPAMVAAPGYTNAADYRAVLDHCEKMKNRVAILDGPAQIADVKEMTDIGTVDAPGAADGKPQAAKPIGRRPPESKYGAVYFPWLVVRDPFGTDNITIPPSGHIAGIYSFNDVQRGVHKAPANYAVRTAIGLSQRITREQQGALNQAGVNVIRFFPDSGIRVWGARQLSKDPEWRYVNVRRTFIMIEESIGRGTQWVVFEPNDQITRNSVIRDCRAFLTLQWLAGALVGATREEAFFVKCDAENNPPEVVDAGRLVVDIGIAPSKPAEFIVFRIGQWQGGTDKKQG
jgi:phage tail sheath protein FI